MFSQSDSSKGICGMKAWLLAQPSLHSATGVARAPSRQDVCHFIVNAWKGITEKDVIASFRKAGFYENLNDALKQRFHIADDDEDSNNDDQNLPEVLSRC